MTLLPNKHVPTERSLVGIGALLLNRFEKSITVSSLWDSVKEEPEIGAFCNYILALDFLYTIGAIDLQQGFLVKVSA